MLSERIIDPRTIRRPYTHPEPLVFRPGSDVAYVINDTYGLEGDFKMWDGQWDRGLFVLAPKNVPVAQGRIFARQDFKRYLDVRREDPHILMPLVLGIRGSRGRRELYIDEELFTYIRGEDEGDSAFGLGVTAPSAIKVDTYPPGSLWEVLGSLHR